MGSVIQKEPARRMPKFPPLALAIAFAAAMPAIAQIRSNRDWPPGITVVNISQNMLQFASVFAQVAVKVDTLEMRREVVLNLPDHRGFVGMMEYWNSE